MQPSRSFRLALLPGIWQFCQGYRLFLPLLLSILLHTLSPYKAMHSAACQSDNSDVRGRRGARLADTHTRTHTHALKLTLIEIKEIKCEITHTLSSESFKSPVCGFVLVWERELKTTTHRPLLFDLLLLLQTSKNQQRSQIHEQKVTEDQQQRGLWRK